MDTEPKMALILQKHVVNRIKTYAFAIKGMSRHKLAMAAGVSESATRDIHKATWNPTLSTLLSLEAVVPDDFQFMEIPKSFNKPIERTKEDDRKKPKK